MNDVTAQENALGELFKPGERLTMPPYQRSYSWGEAEAGELLSDLLEATEAGESHFIGAVVFVRPSPEAPAEIVDGQQRLTTLSMLLAVLRDLEADPERAAALHALIGDPPRALLGEDASWRLTLNHIDGPYFRARVQDAGATKSKADETGDSDSQIRMNGNIELFVRELEAIEPQRRRALAQMVVERCHIVRVNVADRDAGYKVFRVLNTRGKEPNAHDIIKTDLFERAGFSIEQADRHARMWSEHEARLGGAAFDDLLRQIRFIHDRSLRGDMITGFRRAVISRFDAETFLEDMLPKYVRAFDEISQGEAQLGPATASVARSLSHLRSLSHQTWRAPAIKFLVNRRDQTDQAAAFFQRLERLGFILQLVIHDRDQRSRRYRKVLDAIDTERDFGRSRGAFGLSGEDGRKVRDRLLGRFSTFGQRRALALRLNAALEGGEVLPAEADATVEHVLPRNPEPESRWLTVWPHARDRREYCDTIGNFVLLPHALNQKADRMTFHEKKEVYFGGADGARFALTRDIENEDLWTRDVVERRTRRLANLLCEVWEIP